MVALLFANHSGILLSFGEGTVTPENETPSTQQAKSLFSALTKDRKSYAQ
jgi:hypothetical protein